MKRRKNDIIETVQNENLSENMEWKVVPATQFSISMSSPLGYARYDSKRVNKCKHREKSEKPDCYLQTEPN